MSGDTTPFRAEEDISKMLEMTIGELRSEVYILLCSGKLNDDDVRSSDHDITVEYSIADLTHESS